MAISWLLLLYFMITFPYCSWHYSTSFQSFLWGLQCWCWQSIFVPPQIKKKKTPKTSQPIICQPFYKIWLLWEMIGLPNIVLFLWEIWFEISRTPRMLLDSTIYPNLSVTTISGDMTCGFQFLHTHGSFCAEATSLSSMIMTTFIFLLWLGS